MEHNSIELNTIPKGKNYMQNYNTDSLNTLPQNKDEADHLSPLEKKTAPIELTIDEKLRRKRWLESISDCV